MDEVLSCPICQSAEWQQLFKVTDYSITKEIFELKRCGVCSFIVTSPKPNNENLSRYYESDNYISHSGKSNNLLNWIYILARNYSLKWKLRLANSLRAPGRALDIGCGTGEFLNILKKSKWEVAGVEVNKAAREKAKNLIQQSISESTQETVGQFDLITLWHVMEHLPQLQDSLQEISDKLAPNGTLLIAVPNHSSYDAQNYGPLWAAYDVPRHLWHFNQKSMVLLLQKNGFILTKVIPMKLDAFYVSALSEKYKSNRTTLPNLFRAFLVGAKSNLRAQKTGEHSSLIYIAKK